jgi:cell wall-associated NlpC family hydrolase
MRKILWLLCCCWHVVLATETTIQFSSDVPLLSQEQMTPRFWQTKLAAPQQLLLTPAQIAQRNSETFDLQSEMQPLQSLPAHYSKAELGAMIQSVSKVPTTARFYTDGTALSTQHWQHYLSLLALDQVQAVNPLRFGLVVKRSALRAFPTRDRIVNDQGNPDLDRFAETALFPADAVAVLHSSRDNQWLLVRSFNYTGWLQAADVAIGSKQQVLAYTQQQPFIVITGAKVHTAFNPQLAAVSELQLDMGVRLPLLSAAEAGFNVHGQNPVASHIVQLPLRLADGSLSFTPALLPLSADVQQGYLPFTPYNILAQAFKFLGERYGWGHDYNGRDCTGFISEIFRSFGLLMPRNSGQQGNGGYGRNIRFSADSSVADKQAALAQLQVGDLLYFPGHVALYLGTVNGQPFMIHDVNTLLYPRSNGSIYRGTLNGVAVTPLLPLYATEQQSYFDAMYAIKSLR